MTLPPSVGASPAPRREAGPIHARSLPPADRRRPSRTPAGPAAWRIVRQLVAHVVIEPIRGGRLRRVEWPPGLTVTAAIGLGCYLTAMAIGVAAWWLRSILPSARSPMGMPTAVLVALVALLVVTSALAVSAGWHGPWPLRIVGLVLPLVLFSVPVVAGGVGLVPLVTEGAGWLLLLGMAIWRWRRPYRWWEFTAAVALLAAPMIVIFLLTSDIVTRPDFSLDGLVALCLIAVGIFALPTTMVAGVAVSEVAFTTSAWLVEIVSTQLSRRACGALLLLASTAGVGVVVVSWLRPALPWRLHVISLASTAAVLVLAAAAWLLADRIADRRRGPSSTRLPTLVPPVRRITIVLSVVFALPHIVRLSAMIVLGAPSQALTALGASFVRSAYTEVAGLNPDDIFLVGLVLAALVAALVGVRAAVLGHRGVGELALIMAVLCADQALRLWGLGLWSFSVDALNALTLVVALAGTGMCLVRRRLSARRAEAFAVAVALSLAIRFRDLFSDPLGLVLGGAGGALLIVGLVWNLLTNTEDANGHSDRFPRPARVQAVLAGLSIAMLLYAFNAFAGPIDSFDLEPWITTGAEIFGTGLLLAGIFAALSAAWRDEEVAEPGAPAGQTRSDHLAPAPARAPGPGRAATRDRPPLSPPGTPP